MLVDNFIKQQIGKVLRTRKCVLNSFIRLSTLLDTWSQSDLGPMVLSSCISDIDTWLSERRMFEPCSLVIDSNRLEKMQYHAYTSIMHCRFVSVFLD